MKSLLSGCWGALLCLLVAAGCGQKQSNANLTAADLKAFDSAPVEAKQIWVSAMEAAKTNDYVGAETMLFMLIRQDISEPQKQAANRQIGAVHQRLLAAVEKGDPEAQKALQELQQNPPNRRR
jgi:hypothetical protein